MFVCHHSVKASLKGFMLLQCEYSNSENHMGLIPSLLNDVVIQASLSEINHIKSHFLCAPEPLCPAHLVPVGKRSGQVECWWWLQVVASWRFGTATEPASEPRSAGGSPTAARSHFEPRPCLQKGKCQLEMSEVRTFPSLLASAIYCAYTGR